MPTTEESRCCLLIAVTAGFLPLMTLYRRVSHEKETIAQAIPGRSPLAVRFSAVATTHSEGFDISLRIPVADLARGH